MINERAAFFEELAAAESASDLMRALVAVTLGMLVIAAPVGWYVSFALRHNNGVPLFNAVVGFVLGGISVLYVVWFFSVAWLALIGASTVILGTIKLVLLRSAEHPKGPLLALSALLVAIGALIKLG